MKEGYEDLVKEMLEEYYELWKKKREIEDRMKEIKEVVVKYMDSGDYFIFDDYVVERLNVKRKQLNYTKLKECVDLTPYYDIVEVDVLRVRKFKK